MIRAKTTLGFISPLHIDRLMEGQTIHGTMLSPTRFSFEGEIYLTEESLDNPKNEMVILTNNNGYISVALLSVWNNQKHEKRKVDDLTRQQVLKLQRQKKRTLDARREQFYSAYDFPFSYSVQSKMVMSGLSENSWGDGLKRNSVYHLFVEEAFEDGKLKRGPGSFLCAPNDKGKLFYLNDDSNGSNMPVVSCKACLNIMSRWLRDF